MPDGGPVAGVITEPLTFKGLRLKLGFPGPPEGPLKGPCHLWDDKLAMSQSGEIINDHSSSPTYTNTRLCSVWGSGRGSVCPALNNNTALIPLVFVALQCRDA